jgi:peptide/nickel transport system substrate-binding protein
VRAREPDRAGRRVDPRDRGLPRGRELILREAFDYEFSRLDPTGPHIDPCHLAVYELLVVKGADWRARPRLAESWEVSEDGLRWRLRLRRGARFHSGSPCDAQAVLRPLEHLRFDFPTGQLWYWDPVERVEAVDDRTLVFSLHHPYSRLPSLLWGTHTTIYNEALREAEPERFGFEMADGTGPFRLVSWSPERVVAERFESYDGPAPRLDRIEWHAILDPAGRVAALERGEVDVIHSPPMGAVDGLRGDERFVVVEHPQPSSIYLGLDWRRTELGFDDVRVREAISLAVDRDEIVREVFAGHAAPTWGPVPPGDEYYEPRVDEGRSTDPRKAAELLRAARGDEVIRCECVVQDDAFIRPLGEALARQLADVGVHLELRFEKPFAPFYDACAEGPAAFINKWLWQDAVDAIIGFSSTRCLGFPNWQHASVPALDASFDGWLRAGSRDELHAAASRVQLVAAAELPYVPLVAPNDVWVRTTRLHGFEPHPADLYPLYDRAHLI